MALQVPIVNAPMGGVAGGRLAAAVSRAGGLGMIGMGSSATTAKLEDELAHTRGLDRPLGIGLIGWVVDREPALLDAALAARPALLSVSFGDDWSWVARAHDAGATTATQVADLDEARRAADAGVDVLVARGAEGGGHGRPRVGTLPLLAEVVEQMSVPVLAAGGIGSARALSAVLAAGAAGAWVGTALAACEESLLTDPARATMFDAHSADTLTTRAFDVALGYPWPLELPERVLRNTFTDRWRGREDEIDDAARDCLRAAIAADDYAVAPINAGQAVGQVTSTEPAAAVIARLAGTGT
ncbi:2-nitropropane dioxygenase [Mycolicibacterium duvalii]|uniref:2-nitropropane dioxygenase n=1 Tax=Mycolicibacterium duvalii TaxID=39688 RepID=A0A7I7K3I8_9MYCO|nr:nitronate monooxygenase [Mycolicibacterium duvalii]MCV7367765.1 nitronate monooxygenase [Mycolicibacterium duvalii]PEG39457.1 2-nitropropane dioxygenase [Mycolicibacterium duvalii]BBX18645.1 2-nitropropane dioxygenase [Mycolicibacterium duvalii]